MRAPGSMKIVHVVRQFHPGVGGIENFVDQLSSRQAALGHDVKVVTLDRNFSDPDGARLEQNEMRVGVRVRRLPFVGSPRYPVAWQVLFELEDADIVHVHAVDFFCDFLAATSLFHRKPLVLSTHGGFFHTGFASRLKKVYFASVTRSSLSQYGAVIACSAEDDRLFRPVSGPRLIRINNPVDIDKFAGLAKPEGKTIIYFGRLAPNKEIERLIEWFAGLAKCSDEWSLTIAGKPMGLTIDAIEARIASLELTARISVHDSPTDAQLGALIQKSSVYACASSYEGFGLAAVEAASAGLFPLLSRIPPFEDTVRRLGYGMLVDFERPGDWSQSYNDLIEGLSHFAARFDQSAVRASVEQFDWSVAAPAFVDVYKDVLGQGRRRVGKIKVDVLSRNTAARNILDAVQSRRSMMVAFCNAHTVNLAQSDPLLREALGNAVILNDGVGLDMASKMLFGTPFPENLNGTDFVPFILGTTDTPIRLFMLGGEAGVAKAAADKIEAKHPNVTIVGVRDGFFPEHEEKDVLDEIRRSDANLVLVAMGQPRQELWASRYSPSINGPVICVGALFDFMAARFRRAPLVTRKYRLEWAFRLAQEPGRLARRYLFGNIAFLMRIMRQKLVGTRI